MKQARWRSKIVWAAVVAQVFSILQVSGLARKWGVDLGTAGDVTAGILQLLVLLGILNDPTNQGGF